MDARFYNSDDIDIERLASDIANVYIAQGYQAQHFGNRDQMLIQLKKGGDFEAIIGMQAAISLTIQRTAGGVLAMIGRQRWVDKAAVGAVGLVAFPVLWPLALTAGAGAWRQASLGNQALNIVDGLVRQQRPGIQAGPLPSYLLPQVQQQWGAPNQPQQQQIPYYIPSNSVVEEAPQQPALLPMPAPMPAPAPAASGLRCAHCNTPYEPGDTFCSGCGRALTAPKLYCPNCNSELKAGTSFCPKCGASTFSTVSGAQSSAIPKPGPAPQPPRYTPPAPQQQSPVYQPPTPPAYQPPTPTYTPPPAAPAKPTYTPPASPPTPVYTPPPVPTYTPPTPQTPAQAPQPQIYYTPSSQQQTAPAPTPQQPPEQYYVPPETQEPTIKPQPKVTMMPGTQRQEPPPPQKARPQKQYYIPSNPDALKAQQDVDNQATLPSSASQAIAGQPTMPAQPARSANEQTANQATGVWGTLTFSSNGQQIDLSGEEAVVGRYDHDLGGVQPAVDLSKFEAADTVSRVHATFEHTGDSYTLTDLNSTNSTRVNGKRLEPDTPTPINDGDSLQFGKITSTFNKKG
ncbi:hypothetical protein KDA_24020 [Dictyobacter alpinus]|uniref:FHA domain-containing protein n=1 Tax=Dictyobacter alpinus TaxID=2014873 RepID=A0A402B6E6_9CHLR|nr:FHA domain-containing protein [Dictyobacter alpinus]GCE26918.1 hypothetical protein KDA_24020 [Dictyobacter alpinus]